MKCEVCGAEIREGYAECPRCKYPVIVSVGNSPELDKERSTLAREYRKRLIGDAEIGFVAYSHKVTTDSAGNERLEPDCEEEISFGFVDALQDGETAWNPEGFLHPNASSMEVSLFLRQSSRVKKWKTVIAVGPGKEDCYIGMRKTGPVTVKICLRSSSTINESEEISLL